MLDYPYFKRYFKLIAKDWSKQRKLDPDPKEIQQINFTGNLDKAKGSKMSFNNEEAKETVLWVFQKKRLKYCDFILI